MNLNEARQARERLKPFVRILDDLDASIDFASHVESDYSSLSGEIPKLRAERDKIEKELPAMRAAMKDAANAYAKQTDDLQKSHNEQTGKREKELNDLSARLLSAENGHKKRMAEMESEYRTRVDALKKVVADLEAKRDSLIADVQARKERVMAL